MLLGLAPVSHAGRYLCGNAKQDGSIGPNARKVTVKAPSQGKAIAKARKRMTKKGYKVNRLRCVVI